MGNWVYSICSFLKISVIVLSSSEFSIWFFLCLFYLLFLCWDFLLFKIVLAVFIIAYQSIFIMTSLKSLSGNPNIAVTSAFVSIDLFHSKWEFSFILVWWVIFYWNLDIWCITRLWILFKSFLLASLFWHHSNSGRREPSNLLGPRSLVFSHWVCWHHGGESFSLLLGSWGIFISSLDLRW